MEELKIRCAHKRCALEKLQISVVRVEIKRVFAVFSD